MPRRLPAALHNVTAVRSNQRFRTYKATLDGRKVFVKQASHLGLRHEIRSELWGLRSFGDLARAADLPFQVPVTLLSAEDYVVTTWAPGRPMRIRPGSPQAPDDIDLLTTIYARIDSATKLSGDLPSNFALSSQKGEDEAARLFTALSTVPYERYVKADVVEKAFETLRRDLSIPTARLTHADLTPQHILRTASGTVTLIDYDSCSLLWPRFYDVVNFAFNSVVHDTKFLPLARQVVDGFFHKIGEPAGRHRRALNVIAAVRGLSSIYEHLSEPNDVHNTTETLTRERAAFIERSLTLIARGRFFLPAR